jgi:ribosomal protein L10
MAIKKTLSKADKKQAYDKKLCKFLGEYSRVLIAQVDNVGSTQLAAVRRGIRGESEILMGKNTLIRRCIKVHAEATGNEKIKAIIPLLQVSPLLPRAPGSGLLPSLCLRFDGSVVFSSSNLVLLLLLIEGKRGTHLHQG